MCLFALIYQGISFEHAKEVRKTYLNPALFSYYKEPVFICKVQLWIFTDILKSGRHSVIVFPYHTPINHGPFKKRNSHDKSHETL